MSVPGHLVGVTEDRFGGVLTEDLAIGDTVVHVDSTVFFDEEQGGQLLIGGAHLAYEPFDDDDEDADSDGPTEIPLTAASTVAADEGDPVWAFDPTTGADDPVAELVALVTIDDRDDGNAVPARIRAGLADQLDSDFETYLGKAVELNVIDGELVLVDILGSKRTGAVKGKALDTHTVTALGDQTMQLTYRPLPQTEHLRWDGDSQEYDQFSRDGWTVTVPDPDHIFEVGDVLTMQYLYTDPTPRPIVPATLEFIGTRAIANGTTAVTPPDGSETGDLFVFMATAGSSFGSHDTTCTDARVIAQLVTEPSTGGPWPQKEGVAYGLLTTLDDVEVSVSASDNSVQAYLSVYRFTGTLAASLSHGDLTNAAAVDCHPTQAAGSVGVLAVAAGIGTSDLVNAGWTEDQVTAALGLWEMAGLSSAHVLNTTTELAIWTALWIGVSDA